MQIPILNIYYLLCYAWNRLEEGQTIPVSQLDKNEVSQLFATVLIEGTSHLIKKGLDRGYASRTDEIAKIRGKIDFPLNIKKNYFSHPRLYCNYDELDYNVLHNQIVKNTIKAMVNCQGVEASANEKLKSLYLRLHSIDDIQLSKKSFRKVQLNRNNSFYDFMIKVCELIYDNLLINKSGGKSKFRDFLRDEKRMSLLFEEFVRNFYKRHLCRYKVSRSHIKWQLSPFTKQAADFLPRMETDITLKSANRRVIIDTKYYTNTLSGNDKIHSANLYQLFAYLKNQEDVNDAISLQCEGLLLYPTTHQELRHEYQYEGHKISIQTINMNQDWKNIEKDLLSMADSTPKCN